MDAKKAQKLVKDYKRKNPVDISGYVVLIDDAIEAQAKVGREALNVGDLCSEKKVTRPHGRLYDELADYYRKAGLKVEIRGLQMLIDWQVQS